MDVNVLLKDWWLRAVWQNALDWRNRTFLVVFNCELSHFEVIVIVFWKEFFWWPLKIDLVFRDLFPPQWKLSQLIDSYWFLRSDMTHFPLFNNSFLLLFSDETWNFSLANIPLFCHQDSLQFFLRLLDEKFHFLFHSLWTLFRLLEFRVPILLLVPEKRLQAIFIQFQASKIPSFIGLSEDAFRIFFAFDILLHL